jgi:hypothetical protein
MPVQLHHELMALIYLTKNSWMGLNKPLASECSLLFAIGYENRMPSINKKIEHSASRPIIGTKPTPTLANLFISIDSMPGLVQVDTELIQGLMPYSAVPAPPGIPVGVGMCYKKHPIRSGSGDVQELLEVSFPLLVDRTGHVEVTELLENRVGTFQGHFEELAQECHFIGRGLCTGAGLFGHFDSFLLPGSL